MSTFIVFLVSLILIAILFTIRGLDIFYGKKIISADLLLKSDQGVLKMWNKIKYWWGHINFKNCLFVFFWIRAKIIKMIILIKRHFDHKQSHFFTQKSHDSIKNNTSASFFLKDVTEYKKNLREEGIEGRIER